LRPGLDPAKRFAVVRKRFVIFRTTVDEFKDSLGQALSRCFPDVGEVVQAVEVHGEIMLSLMMCVKPMAHRTRA
jgi:hypothetical protein